MRTGSRRVWSQGAIRTEANVTLVSPAVSGASVSLAGAIPKGATVLGVQSYIRTALGTSLGCTGYQLGIASDLDLYGVRNGVGLGGGTDDGNWTANGGGYQPAAQTLVLTPTGGSFDGPGTIEVTLQYSLGVRNGDLV